MNRLDARSIESQLLSEAPIDGTEWEALQELITHSHISLGQNWQLLIKKSDVRSDKEQYKIYDFKNFYLPQTEWHKPAMTFVDRPKFVGGVVLAAQSYFQRVPEITKSTTSSVVKIISDVSKFFEYCWLEGIYDPNDVTEDFWLEMQEKLVVGGWGMVLGIQERIDMFVSQNDIDTLRQLVLPPALGLYSLNVPVIRRALGTNAKIDLLSHNAWSLYEKIRLPSRRKNLQAQAPYPPSHPISAFGCMQSVGNLSQIPHPYCVEAAAYVEICRPSEPRDGRTKNIQVDDVAELLWNSMTLINRAGPIVCTALEEIAVGVAHRRIHDLPEPGKWIESQVLSIAPQIAKFFPDVKIGSRDMPDLVNKELSFRDLIVILQLACFVVIAGLNARRRDEVSSNTIGIYRSGSKIEDAILGIYSVDFYLEKSLNNYKTFYVGKATYVAVSLLNRMFDAFRIADLAIDDNDAPKNQKEEKLFSYRRLSVSNGIATVASWFSVSDAIRQGKIFYLISNIEFEFKSHTLRRFYALVFYYRYEHGTLQALMYQMGDDSMIGLLTYITDPQSRPELEAIDAALSGASFNFDTLPNKRLAETLVAVQEVGGERLDEIVEAALLGKVSGGYAKYIRRLDLQFVKTADYRKEELNARVRILSRAVRSSGHWPKPKPHGDCLAGGERASKIAHCATEDKHSLQQENASPKTCAKCPYSYVSRGYYDHMHEDLFKLKSKMTYEPMGHFEKVGVQREIKNLEEALELHAKRLGI